ncbi:MAG TPA: hypothetical protein PKK43_12465, partial [Spirochaetota bacterium]|nr:hypothetical protein [Spirochaetota bacterium]
MTDLDEKAFNIYTDGSSLPKPRRGGIGIFLIYYGDTLDDECNFEFSCPTSFPGATNNQMELKACIEGLKCLKEIGNEYSRYKKVIIHSDSKYVCEYINKAKFEWPRMRWQKKSGAPVLNAHLWK